MPRVVSSHTRGRSTIYRGLRCMHSSLTVAHPVDGRVCDRRKSSLAGWHRRARNPRLPPLVKRKQRPKFICIKTMSPWIMGYNKRCMNEGDKE